MDDYKGGADALDDLGVKASDLLQANGIIWVEGPSDRAYIHLKIRVAKLYDEIKKWNS